MANLALAALTLAAIVAFSEVSAYRTTITTTTTTTVEDNGFPPYVEGLPTTTDQYQNPRGSQEQCRREIPVEQLNHCEMHLTEGIVFDDKLKMVVENMRSQQHLQQCCSQLQNFEDECQCKAIQRVYDEARQQGGVLEMRQMLRKAASLPKDCRLQLQDCPIASPRV